MVVPADEHAHKSARVEAHEYKEKGDVDEGTRILNELRSVSDIGDILRSVTHHNEGNYCTYTAKMRVPDGRGRGLRYEQSDRPTVYTIKSKRSGNPTIGPAQPSRSFRRSDRKYDKFAHIFTIVACRVSR